MGNKSFDELMIRVFLQKLNAAEIVNEVVIPTMDAIALYGDTPEKTFHELAMHLVEQVRAYLVIHDREDLRDYPETTQKCVFSLMLAATSGKIYGDVLDKVFKDWSDSKVTFNEWRFDFRR